MPQTSIPTVDPFFKCFRGDDPVDLAARISDFLTTQAHSNANAICRSVNATGAGCGATFLVTFEWIDSDAVLGEGEFAFGVGAPAACALRLVADAEDGIRDALVAVKAELTESGNTQILEPIIAGGGDGAVWLVGAVANPPPAPPGE
jgi:hypothetical protein